MGFFGDIFGGASKADKALAADQKSFMDTMHGETATAFAGQQDALNKVLGAWAPIIAGGPNQYGFSTAEEAQQRADIINTGQTAATNTVNAALLRDQQASGGASTMPAGGREALTAQIAATGAQRTATELGREKEMGYQVGREQFKEAQAGVTEVAKVEAPAALGGVAVGAGEAAQKAQTAVDTANASSLGAKLLGGAISGITGAATGGLGTAVSTLGSGNFGW
jgi:hypothetical protein